MIVVRLYGQFYLSGMVCYYPAAVIPADVIDGFSEGVEGKHREGGEHHQHDASACLRGQIVQIAFEPCHQHFLFVVELPVRAPQRFSDTFSFHVRLPFDGL